MLDSLVKLARARGASDLHLESGVPPVLRIDGKLKISKEAPIGAEALLAVGRSIIGEANWPAFLEQCSYDEIAEITGISKKNVSVRLTRIRERLRSELHIQNQTS